MSNQKLKIASSLISLIPSEHGETVDRAMVTWWCNLRENGGLRLTKHGYNMLHNILKIESWTVDIEKPHALLTKKLLLSMDRKLKWPYYLDIKNKHMIFFSSKEAMMASLYGDIRTWLDQTQ